MPVSISGDGTISGISSISSPTATFDGNVSVGGTVTSTDFVDGGTNLLTEINTKTSTGKAIAMAMIFG